MSPEIAGVDNAANWSSYLAAWNKLFQEVLASRWALGRVSMAGHIHHTVIPDASGQVTGGISWAAYSQPSAETLSAFFTVFGELLKSQPSRITSNRYLFFTLRDPPASSEQARSAFAANKAPLRYSLHSMEAELECARWLGPVRATTALYAGDSKAIADFFSNAKDKGDLSSPAELQEALCALALGLAEEHQHKGFEIPDYLIARSAILLSAALAKVAHEPIVSALGTGSAVATMIALHRARESHWDSDLLDFLSAALEFAPKEFETYKVVPGDILGRIVREKYGVSFDKLWPIISAVNPKILDPNFIRAGQEILLPKLS